MSGCCAAPGCAAAIFVAGAPGPSLLGTGDGRVIPPPVSMFGLGFAFAPAFPLGLALEFAGPSMFALLPAGAVALAAGAVPLIAGFLPSAGPLTC